MQLFALLQDVARSLIDRGYPVEASFEREDDGFYSPEIDDAITSWESVDIVQERTGCRYISYSEKGARRFTASALDDTINRSIEPEAVSIIRETVTRCQPA